MEGGGEEKEQAERKTFISYGRQNVYPLDQYDVVKIFRKS